MFLPNNEGISNELIGVGVVAGVSVFVGVLFVVVVGLVLGVDLLEVAPNKIKNKTVAIPKTIPTNFLFALSLKKRVKTLGCISPTTKHTIDTRKRNKNKPFIFVLSYFIKSSTLTSRASAIFLTVSIVGFGVA